MPIPSAVRRALASSGILAALAACATLAGRSDALARWEPQPVAARAELRSLSVAGPSVAWLGGKFGTYAFTADGGRSWRADSVRGAGRLFFTGVHALSGTGAFLLGTDFAGAHARIYHTGDAGRSWHLQWQMSDSGTFMDGLACWDAERCVAFGDPIGGRFVVVRTDDAGRTWTRLPDAAAPAALPGEAAFAASGRALEVQPGGHAWIGTGGAAHARVLHSADYGRTWTAHETPLPAGRTAGIFAVAFRDATHGAAVGGDYARPREACTERSECGDDNVIVTSDGGRTWTIAGSAQTPGVRYGASWIPGTTSLVAVGPSGTGRSDDGGRTWVAVDTVGFNTVRFATREAGWAAGVDGRIARYRR